MNWDIVWERASQAVVLFVIGYFIYMKLTGQKQERNWLKFAIEGGKGKNGKGRTI